MKKTIFLAIMALAIVAVLPASAQNKQLEKQLKKEYKLKMREYSKGHWKVFGTSRTLEVALLLHYDKLANDGVKEITTQTISSNKNLAKEKLLMNACSKYAQEMGSNIKGRISGDMASKLTPDELEEFEKFYAAYENNVTAEIKGELHNTFCIYREIKHNGVPTYEFEAYFIVDMDAASAARIRAFENAAKEYAVAQKYAEKVSEFIRNGSAE
jgi:hypothetical protein